MSDADQIQSVAKAIHTALTNDISIQSLLGNSPRLYDHVPEDPIYPYLSYGDMRSTDVGGDNRPMTSHALSLHIWSRYSGRAEIMQCLAAVIDALESETFILTDANLVSANILYTDHFRAPDGRTLHGLIRVNITTHSLEEA